jgi:hypothetical protein
VQLEVQAGANSSVHVLCQQARFDMISHNPDAIIPSAADFLHIQTNKQSA